MFQKFIISIKGKFEGVQQYKSTTMDQEHSVSSSSYSSQDEDAVLLTDKVEEKLLTVVAKLRNKDPEMYNLEKPIFQDNDFGEEIQNNGNSDKHQKKEKFTYGDLLLKGNQNQEIEASQEQQESDNPKRDLNRIKDKFKQKLINKNKEIEDQDEDDEMFTVKKKLSAPNKSQKEKTNSFLGKIDQKSSSLLKSLWDNPGKMDKTDQFLKNYILDKKWITSKHLGPDGQLLGAHQEQEMIDEEDEDRSVEMDEYEAKYNFRFEEPGADKITQYPREIPESIRIKPETRKDKRKKTLERKKQEQQKLRKQAQELKAQKKRQILAKLNEEGGMKDENEQKAQQAGEEDFQNDWFFCDDCAKALEENQLHYICDECDEYMLCEECFDLIIHKHEMRKAVIPKGFGPPSQQVAQKALSQLKNCKTCRKKLPGYLKRYEYTDSTYMLSTLCQKCYDESTLDIKKKFKPVEPAANTQNFEQILDKNPEKIKEITCQKDIEDLVDQYMKYDFQDVIGGGLKTKFRYVSVKPQSYGLSDEQILYGDDKELNKYVSIKKLAPYQESQMKLRNNLYKRRVVGIDKSAQQNRRLVSAAGAKLVRKIQKVKSRAEIMRKKRENLKKKLKVVNLTNPENEKKYFLSKSRLASYGLMQQ